MPKYTVTANQLARGGYVDGDAIVDGKPQKAWAHTFHKRGDSIELSEKDAEGHLADGSVSKSDDVPEGDPIGSRATDSEARDTSAPAGAGAPDPNSAKDANAGTGTADAAKDANAGGKK